MQAKGRIKLQELQKMSVRVMLRVSIVLSLIMILLISIALSVVPFALDGNIILFDIFNISRIWHIYLFVLLLIGYFVLAKYSPKRTYKTNKVFQNEIIYNINAEQFCITTMKGSAGCSWDDFSGIREYEDMFLLFYSFSGAYILPKRFFKTKNDIKILKKILLSRKIKKLKLLH